MMSEHDFGRTVAELMRQCSLPIQTDNFFYQDIEGDFVEFFERRDAYVAVYVDRRLTVYHSRTDDKIIGAKLSQVSELLEDAPGIRLEIHGGTVSLEVLFKASCWTTETKIEEAKQLVYKRVGEIAKHIRRRAALCVA